MSHRTQLKVRFYELDPYDHVNHTNYLAYFETARIEFLTEVGFGLDVMEDRGFRLVVVELRARFMATAGLHDILDITTTVTEGGRVTTTWIQEMRREEEMIAVLEVDGAFVGLDGRPRRMPPGFVEAVSGVTAPTGPAG